VGKRRVGVRLPQLCCSSRRMSHRHECAIADFIIHESGSTKSGIHAPACHVVPKLPGELKENCDVRCWIDVLEFKVDFQISMRYEDKVLLTFTRLCSRRIPDKTRAMRIGALIIGHLIRS